MASIFIVILVVAIAYFLFKYFKRTKPADIPVQVDSQKRNISFEAKEETASQEYWQKSKDALTNGDIDKATRLAFQARKKEAEAKGYEFSENSSFGNPLYTKSFVSEIKKLDIPIKGISDEAKEELRTEIMLGTLKGENPKDTERRTRDFLDDFEWAEFDEWCSKFKLMDEWPPLWDTIAEYIYLQEYPIKSLLEELTKDHLMQLSNEYSANAKKSHKKELIIESLVKIIPEQDRNKILAIVNQEWKPKYLREKRFLLMHSLEFLATSLKRIKEQYENNEYIEIGITPDSCSICQQKVKKKLKVATLTEKDIPPFHPGCRCGVLPVI
jgi:hypothetical protein